MPDRLSDAGPIPPAMLDDLRTMLWHMEKPPRYWAVGMAIFIGALWAVGVAVFTLADMRHGAPDKNLPLAIIALSILAALSYSPFGNRCFTETWEARELREVLYKQRLEDLAYHMAVLRMGGEDKLADRLIAIWRRHGLEPGWMARRADPRPQFR